VSRALETEVAIIGGGIAGSATALHLGRAGVPVILLEKGAVGSQASGVNFGGVRQLGRDPVELPLARRSRALWERIEDLIGERGGWSATGNLRIAASEAEEADLERHEANARDHGLAVEHLGRNALAGRYPWIAPWTRAGLFLAEDGQANPRLVAPAFGRAARAAGATVLEDAEVSLAERDGAGFRLIAKGGAIEVRSRLLVNAAGAWAGRIAASFGDPNPVEAHAPQMAVTEAIRPFIAPVLAIQRSGLYVRQHRRGNVVFGSGRIPVDMAVGHARVAPASTLATAAQVVDAVPRLAGTQLIRVWSGVEAYTPDELPVLGPSPKVPGLLHAFGFSGHGFQLGPAVGAVMADLILEGRSETPIDAFRAERFSQPTEETSPGGR